MDALWRLRGTTVSLVGIWLAVPLVGVFGGDIVTETGIAGGNDGTRSTVPAVVPVAAMAPPRRSSSPGLRTAPRRLRGLLMPISARNDPSANLA